MLNLLTSTRPWFTAFLFTTITLFAQENNTTSRPQRIKQGHEIANSQLMSGYSAPARIEVRGTWDLYATGSFIYWQASQENSEIGLISRNNPELPLSDLPFGTNYVNNMTITQPNFTYRPGFKFGLGVNLDWDNWDAYAEYTWFHGSIGSGVRPLSAATTGDAIPPNGEYLYPIQGASLEIGLIPLFFQDANQSWRLKMDFLDLSLARSYYSGTRLTIRPFFGARGAWIRQQLNTTYVGSTTYIVFRDNRIGTSKATINNDLSSWGVGPRTGFQSRWLLGYGTRLIGNLSGDILYTRYNLHLNQQIVDLSTTDEPNPIFSNLGVSQTVDYLRAHADLELGFGWGTYFDNNNWHIDLSATYGFQTFWNQNMFRNFVSEFSQSRAPNGNLYVHGLTFTADFDF